jgi:hypothetical protein
MKKKGKCIHKLQEITRNSHTGGHASLLSAKLKQPSDDRELARTLLSCIPSQHCSITKRLTRSASVGSSSAVMRGDRAGRRDPIVAVDWRSVRLRPTHLGRRGSMFVPAGVALLVELLVFLGGLCAAGTTASFETAPPPPLALQRVSVAGLAPPPPPLAALPQRVAGLGPPYEYPNNSQNVLVVGTFPYPRGPTAWNDTMHSGKPFGGWGLSEGWTYNVAKADEAGRCPPIPEDEWGLRLDRRRLPVNEGPTDSCYIGCNITEIAAGAADPCNGGSIWMDTPRFGRVLANFSCFWGGPGFLKDPTMGQCGFNCTAFDIVNKTPCNIWKANPPKGVKPVCNIECGPPQILEGEKRVTSSR